jgi:hypothetical protein
VVKRVSFREDPLYLSIEKALHRQSRARDKAHDAWLYGKEPWTLERLRASKKKYDAAERTYTATRKRLLRRREVLIRKWGLG